MDAMLLLKFGSAFVFVISLMMMLSWFLKKLGLAGPVSLPGTKRRLKVVEHLAIDHRRRLVLVRRDNREHLLVLGPNGETVVESNIPATEENIVDLAVAKEQKNG